MNGGYSNQLSLITDNGLYGITKGFTNGTAGILTSGVISKIVLLLFFALLVVILMTYFKTVSKTRKNFMIIDLVVLLMVLLIYLILQQNPYGFLLSSPEQMISSPSSYQSAVAQAKLFITIYQIVTVAGIAIFIILVWQSESKWMLKSGLIALGLNFIVIPIVVLLIENIVSLASGILAIVVIGGLVCLAFMFFLGGSGGGTDTEDSSSTSYNLSKEVEEDRLNGKLVIEKNRAFIPNFNETFGYKLRVQKGFFNDYIETYGFMASNRKVCNLDDYRSGKFLIYDSKTGKEIISGEINWKDYNNQKR